MHDDLFVPKLACNLFSVRAAISKGNTVKFGEMKCWIRDTDGKLVGMGSLVEKLYQLDCESVIQEQVSIASQMGNRTDPWHQRLGHVSEQVLKEIVSRDLVKGMEVKKLEGLSICEKRKIYRKPFKSVGGIQSTRKLQRVHSYVCGPMPTESIGGKKYMVTFIDDYSRCCQVYFMIHKSEVLEKFNEFEAITTNESDQRIGALRSDNVSQRSLKYI